MPLRNYKLEHDLVSLPLPGLPVQEAVLDQELLLRLNVGGCSLFVQHLVEGCLKCFTWHPEVFGNLIEDWVLLLFLFPVSDIGDGQPCWSSLDRLFLVITLTVWSLTPCSAHSSMGVIVLLSTALTPGYGIWFKYSQTSSSGRRSFI